MYFIGEVKGYHFMTQNSFSKFVLVCFEVLSYFSIALNINSGPFDCHGVPSTSG